MIISLQPNIGRQKSECCVAAGDSGCEASTAPTCRRCPRWEPYAGKPHVRICAGGEVTRVPTANYFPWRILLHMLRSPLVHSPAEQVCVRSRRVLEGKRTIHGH